MALFRKFFYRKPPDGLLEISERVYVFDSCFTTDVWEDDEYESYIGGIVRQLRNHSPEASFMVFNFREGENQSQISLILSAHDMTVMDYPRHYEGCPLLTMEMVHHFLRSSESWLSLGQHNVLLMHCERGGWPVLAYMLAALLIYRKQFTAEQKTLDMIYKQAPRELLQLMSPLNPVPSQLRYLQYVSRRNIGSEWPPLDRALTLDCVIMRFVPDLDGDGGCRPIFRIYGQDPFMAADRSPKILFSNSKKSKLVRHYTKEDELVKIDIHCHVQGDVVLECITLDGDLAREEMMFRVMFNTAFIRSNILMLNRDEIDILWNAKELYPKDFRAEILLSEMDTDSGLIAMDLPGLEEKEGLPMEAFAKVQEMFSNVDWLDQKTDQVLTAIHGKIDIPSPRIARIEKSSPEPIPLEQSISESKASEATDKKAELKIAVQRPGQSMIVSQRLPQTSLSAPVSYSNLNSLQVSPVSKSRYHSAPSALGITALLHDHVVSNREEELTHLGTSNSTSPLLTTKVAHSSITLLNASDPVPILCPSPIAPLPPPPPPPFLLKPSDSLLAKKITSPPPPPPPPPPVHATKSNTLTPPPPPLPTFLGASLPSVAKKSFSAPPAPPPPPLLPTTSSSNNRKTSFSTPPPPPPKPLGPALPAPPPPPPNSKNSPTLPPPAPPLINVVSKTGSASARASNGNVPTVPAGSPLSGRGRGLVRTASRTQPLPKKTNLKPYHWLKLTRAMQGSLWAEAQKNDETSSAPEFDMSEIESLFSATVPSSDNASPGGKSNRRALGSRPEKVQLIELRRAYNCEIMLSKVKVSLPDLMGSVLALDESALDVDQVENLIKFCPTKEEMELLKNYGGDKQNLGKCEQFFLELMKVPRVESKLKVFAFKIQFCSQVSELRTNLNVINSSSEEIRGSKKLKRIMQTILSLGNALNQGTARGSAIGFRLDSLLKLTDTRARNNKMTLMHYLCKVIAEKLPELLEFPKDLINLEASTKIQLKYLAEEMQAVSKGLEKVIQELSASENDGPVSDSFCKTLKAFLDHAEADVRSLTALYTHVGRNADILALYFGEDPTRCPFEQGPVVMTLLNFVRMFVRAHEENCKQIEMEKKKAQTMAENESRLGTPMDSQHLFRTPLKSGNLN